jgi:hypothetical protein
MAFKSIRHFLTISTVLLLLSVMTPSGNARAMTDGLDGTSLPSLETFVEQVGNGQPDELRGVYIVVQPHLHTFRGRGPPCCAQHPAKARASTT